MRLGRIWAGRLVPRSGDGTGAFGDDGLRRRLFPQRRSTCCGVCVFRPLASYRVRLDWSRCGRARVDRVSFSTWYSSRGERERESGRCFFASFSSRPSSAVRPPGPPRSCCGYGLAARVVDSFGAVKSPESVRFVRPRARRRRWCVRFFSRPPFHHHAAGALG